MSAPDLVPPGTTGGGAPVGGSGTIGTIPKWGTTTTLNDSVITQSGAYVGIGAPIPGSTLHINSDSQYALQVSQPTTSRAATAYFTNVINYLYVGVESGSGAAIGSTVPYSGIVSSQNAYPLVLMTNASPRMTILSGGNVGIGTTSPLTRLDVAGSGRVTATASSALTGTADPTVSATLVGTGTLFTTELVVGDRITVNAETRTVTAIASATSLTVDTAFTDTASASVTKLPAILVTRLSSNAVALVQNDLGNVGIGTTIPTAALHLKAGTAAANTAPLKLTSGTNLTTAEEGAFEYDGTNLYFTTSTGRKTVTLI